MNLDNEEKGEYSETPLRWPPSKEILNAVEKLKWRVLYERIKSCFSDDPLVIKERNRIIRNKIKESSKDNTSGNSKVQVDRSANNGQSIPPKLP
ncbi:hypothetical protein CDAR_177111 [Caerostris darwini]|uniref:Uncharacterized protein n=1 Tax=Caerostris darwini TaxID=1538125 RepID=A0AAV4NQ28_9ARAC|nr:hypothetical protein CDAR_177111 [Caerostris darwini]